MLPEIEIPEFNDPDWQIEQLRLISKHIENLKDMSVDEVAFDELLAIEAHVEALREYSGY
jgi:hypothetical protein